MSADSASRPEPTAARHLGMLAKGESAIVAGLAAEPCPDLRAARLRLLELGFVPGETVRVMARAFPAGDPLAVRIGNSTFALRRHEAALVRLADAS